MMIDLTKAAERLQALKNELEALTALTVEARETVQLDQQSVGRLSRMDALQNQAMAEAQQRTRQHDLIRIDMGFRRIADGEYGYCADCGEEIPDRRLAIDPMAERCVNCA